MEGIVGEEMGGAEGGDTVIRVYYRGKIYFQSQNNTLTKRPVKRYLSHKKVDGKLLDWLKCRLACWKFYPKFHILKLP